MEFEPTDFDQEGLDVLDVLSSANKFNNWMYQTISPFCTGNILEIGSGIGNISQYFIKDNQSIFLSDLRLNYKNFIKNKFGLNNERVLSINIADGNFNNKYIELLNRFDSVFCLNVLEHIKDDNLAIENMLKMLKSDGRLTVLVPVNQMLYNGIDSALKHYRRYSKGTLEELMLKHGNITNIFYFNALGIFAWFIGGKLFKKKTIPHSEMKLYNLIVPLCKFVDMITFKKVGLSIVVVIKKTSDTD